MVQKITLSLVNFLLIYLSVEKECLRQNLILDDLLFHNRDKMLENTTFKLTSSISDTKNYFISYKFSKNFRRFPSEFNFRQFVISY